MWQQYRGIVRAYVIVWAFVLFFGGLRMHNLGDTFYQRNVEVVVPDVIKASCVVSQQVVSPAELFRMTAEQAEQGRELIIWAEEALEIHSAEDEDTLVSNASKAAAELGIYLGVSYETSFQTAHRNMFVFYGPGGEQLMYYQKAFPVPLSESNVVPGKASLPIVDTKWGKVGAAICFDYDFPQYIMEVRRFPANKVWCHCSFAAQTHRPDGSKRS
jgi:apolipoprotein N-acyltransferase